MGWFSKKKVTTNASPDGNNISIMTEVFSTCHDGICAALNKCLEEPGVFGQKISLRIEKASKFEIGMYLLFRLDRQMCNKQNQNVRYALFCSCIDSILPSKDNHFIGLVNNRQDVYSEIFNRNKNSGRKWEDCLQEYDDWLMNAILYSKNEYSKMTTKNMPLVIAGITEHMHIKISLSSMESDSLIIFECILNHVFADNDDFTLLSDTELLGRIQAGQQAVHPT